MKRQLATILAIGFALVLTGEIIAQPPSNSRDPVASRHENQGPKNDAEKQAILNDISSIRSRFGGGVARQFLDLNDEDGKDWHRRANQEFERELQRLAAADFRANLNGNSQRDVAERTVEGESPVQGGHKALQHSNPLTKTGQGNQERFGGPVGVEMGRRADRPSRRLQELRSAARLLEEIAAGFEETGLYTDADKIRRQAGQFWIRAREMGQSGRSITQPQMGPIHDSSSEN